MNKHVLVIEDDRFMREAVDLILTQAGYLYSGAGTGEEGLRMLRRSIPDLILLDIALPRMGGLEVLRGIRQRGVTIPVLMLTANSSPLVVGDVLAYGGTGYILKPFQPQALVERVRAALSSDRGERNLRAVSLR